MNGPMVEWPRVEVVEGAKEVLSQLHVHYRLALATNAVQSTEEQIRGALQRIDVAEYIELVYCFRTIGMKKPSPEFFKAVLQNSQAAPGDTLMVGDSLENDVMGAVRSGLKAVWLNEVDGSEEQGVGFFTIHRLSDLPEAVRLLFSMDENSQA